MIIRPKTTRIERLQPVTYGVESHGKRMLVKAVMDAGYPKRLAEKAVDGLGDHLKTGHAGSLQNRPCKRPGQE